jgi:phosphopantetheinyl transferase
VDIEHLGRQLNFKNVVDARFSETEAQAVKLDMPEQQVEPRRMLSAWTSKEAYGKALGLGINFEMNKVTTYHGAETCSYEEQRNVSITRIRAPEDHIVSVAHLGKPGKQIDTFELVKID